MRFAYIDSQGNEVSIPSVDALALRIELGAIGPHTELYDVQSDRWGPAESHEIYHTLARDVGGEDFLIPTPPPPGDPAPSPADVAEPPPAPTAGKEASEPEAELVLPPKPAEDSVPSTAEDMGLTLAPPDSSDGDTDHALTPEDLAPDWGDEDILPAEELADADPLGTPAADFGLELDGPSAGGGDDDLDLEPALDFGGGSEEDFGTGLDLEPPMSDFDPGAPPAWMEQEGPAMDDGESLMDFSAGLDEGGEAAGGGPGSGEAPVEPRPRPTPRPNRPPPRRPAPRRSVAKPLLIVLLLGAVGAGGWYGWQRFGDRLVPPPPRPEVVIPEIPAELEPPMREIAETALARMFAEIEDRAFPGGAPEAPSEDWLAGVYLGTASDFPDVAEFWTGISAFAERLRTEEAQAFHDAYVDLASASDVGPDAVPVIVERADSGFLATQPERARTYDLLEALAGAALSLHDFLVANEDQIQYTPARGFAGNPVEEAVPATEEIGDEMWALVEEITNALDRLGTLDRVSRERLNTVVLQRIRETGIR